MSADDSTPSTDGDLEESERVDEPDASTSSEMVAGGREHGKLVHGLIWFVQNGHYFAIGAGFLLVGIVLLLGIEIPRSTAIIAGSFAIGALLFGWPTGSKAVQLMGGPQLMWLVDVDLLDRDGAGIYNCPTPRWSAEWEVTKDELWWATPNLAFGKHVDVEERTVEGTWPGSLPEPVLMRALVYLRYNRNQLEKKAKVGEAIEMNAFAMIRAAVIRTTRSVVRTFEEGTLPDDGAAFREEIDSVLEDFDLQETELFDEADGIDLGDGAESFDFRETVPTPEVNADD